MPFANRTNGEKLTTKDTFACQADSSEVTSSDLLSVHASLVLAPDVSNSISDADLALITTLLSTLICVATKKALYASNLSIKSAEITDCSDLEQTTSSS